MRPRQIRRQRPGKNSPAVRLNLGVSIAQLEVYLTEEEHADFGESPPAVFTEGGRRRVEISVRERSASARLASIRHHGSSCFICGFDFGRFYGKRAKGFIEVHHRKQISESSGLRPVDAVSDLVPLCANCHRVVHLTNPPADVEALKEEIQKRPNQSATDNSGAAPRRV